MKLDMSQMAAHAQEAEDFLKGLSNKNRLMILCVLTEGELSVGELNEQVPLSQSSLSQHLSVLRAAGLVATRRESQAIFYSLGDKNVQKILKLLHSMFCDA